MNHRLSNKAYARTFIGALDFLLLFALIVLTIVSFYMVIGVYPIPKGVEYHALIVLNEVLHDFLTKLL